MEPNDRIQRPAPDGATTYSSPTGRDPGVPTYPQANSPGVNPTYGVNPQAHGALGPRLRSGMATAALILGILSIISGVTVVGGIILGLLALIFGIIAARRARRGEALGHGRAVAGIVTGIIGIVLAIALIGVGASLLNTKAGKDLRSCLNNAGTNQTQIRHCDSQFQHQITK